MSLQRSLVKISAEKAEFDYSSDPWDSKTPNSILLPSTQARIPRDFTITTDSYISLCSRVYAACCSMSQGFARNVSESVFQYYAIIHLWKRFAQVLPSSAKNGSEFFTEIQHIGDFYLPLPLHTYLEGVGYFRDPDGCDRRLTLPVVPINEKIDGLPYTFGRVNAKTHFLYEAFPAPGIAIMRILADIRYTKEPCGENFLWNLPEELGPDIQDSKIESVQPTKNLLGWAPAQRLTTSQLNLCEKYQLDDNFVPNSSANNLFSRVDEYFWQKISPRLHKAAGHISKLPRMGSLVQGMTIEKHNDFLKFDRSAMYCEGQISVCSPYQLNDNLNKGAVISGYRMAKEQIGAAHSWSCYDFDEYKNVPESWIRTRNMIYTYGSSGRLNETVYTTGHIAKRILQNECIQHSMSPPTTNWNILQ